MKRINYLSFALVAMLCSCVTNKDIEVPHLDEHGIPLCEKDRLHDVTITKAPSRKLIGTNSQGERVANYKIVCGDISDASQALYCKRAASYIASNLSSASGVEFEVIEEKDLIDVNKTDKYIFVGSTFWFDYFGLRMPEEKLGISGYYMISKNDMVFIQVNTLDGYQPAATHFLKYVIGWDMVAEDTIVIDEDCDFTLPTLKVIERPDFELANATNQLTSSTVYGMGFTTHYPFMVPTPPNGTKGATWHNINNFIDPTAENIQAHPSWFAENPQNLCFCCRDNESEYNLMVEEAFKCVKATVDNVTECNILNITQLDVPSYCECEFCNRHKEEDGSVTGMNIRFMNDVDDKLQAYLEEQARVKGEAKREVYLQFFAYLATNDPPTKSVEEDPTLKCNPNVMICIAPLHANFTKTFYDKENEKYAQNIIDWEKYCSKSTAWLYETDYHHYMYPYNTYYQMIKNARFMKEHGSVVMLSEGQRYNTNVTCFGKFKEYIGSNTNFNVNVSYNELYEKFFDKFYMDAAPYMKKYFEQMNAYMEYLESRPDEFGLGGGVYQEIGNVRYWPKQLLLNWLDIMDDAFKAINKYKSTNTALYQKLYKHILTETLFPRYALCDLHPESYSQEEIFALRSEFKKDATALGVNEFAEHDYEKDAVNAKYESWGLK